MILENASLDHTGSINHNNTRETMKKAWFLALIILFSVEFLGAYEKPDFDRIVDFSVSLKELVTLVKNPSFNPEKFGKILVFDGSISAITLVDKNPSSFSAELVVVNGEWKGTEEVSLFQAFVYAEGPGFAKRLPERKPRTAEPGLISQNDHILVVGRVADVYIDEKGNRYPIVAAYYIRVLQ